MFTRNLALTVATAALLSASALPAMAANPPLFFDFSTTYTAPLATPNQTLTGRWTTNDAGSITGLQYLKLNGTPVTYSSASGSYTSAPNTTGFNPATTYTITGLQYSFNPGGAGGLPSPTVTTIYNGTPGPFLQTFISDGPPSGGVQTGTTYYQNFTMTALPEIDGGVLPKALFVVAGAFLMFFGRNKHSEA